MHRLTCGRLLLLVVAVVRAGVAAAVVRGGAGGGGGGRHHEVLLRIQLGRLGGRSFGEKMSAERKVVMSPNGLVQWWYVEGNASLDRVATLIVGAYSYNCNYALNIDLHLLPGENEITLQKSMDNVKRERSM